VELCPKTVKKIEEKMGFFLENWVFGECWGKTGNRGVWVAGGGCGYGGEWPEVVSRWWGRWWVVVGVGGFGFREKKDGGGVG
jgi:hypothetical protein